MFPLGIDDRTWIWAGAILYSFAFLFALHFVIRSRKYSRPLLFGIIACGFLFQTIGLYLRGMEIGGCPLGNAFEIIQFIVWSLILLYMVVGPAFRMSLLGFFSAGLSAVLGVTSLLAPGLDAQRTIVFGDNVWLELHAALALFSYGVFGILALTSSMYLLQNYSLKKKKMKGIFGFLPSIRQLEQMNFRLLLTGLVLLTISLTIGSHYGFYQEAAIQGAKLAFTAGIWAAYLIVFVLRLRLTLVAEELAWTCIALFLVSLVSIWPIDASRKPIAQTPVQPPPLIDTGGISVTEGKSQTAGQNR
ncbi:MAG: cytochrome c biogenesis protein CcsA [Opitutales bacterium]